MANRAIVDDCEVAAEPLSPSHAWPVCTTPVLWGTARDTMTLEALLSLELEPAEVFPNVAGWPPPGSSGASPVQAGGLGSGYPSCQTSTEPATTWTAPSSSGSAPWFSGLTWR